MNTTRLLRRVMGCGVALLLMLMGVAPSVRAGEPEPPQGAAAAGAQGTLEIYGFAQADAIDDLKQIDPNWYDTARPSRLPKVANEFGADHNFYLSPRQSRFGVRGEAPTESGPVKGQFEFDMFGVGADAGQTTIRLRHAYGQWKNFGAGLTNSAFTDPDIFPNILDYWGPNGMLFFRNVQVFWEPYSKGNSTVRIAAEKPGASGDAGIYADRVELQNVTARFPSPDFTGHWRVRGDWGHFQLGGALRYIAYDDTLNDKKFDLSGHVWGWGLSASSNLKLAQNNVLHLQVVEGAGVENYFNDAPVDVGVQSNPGNTVTPVVGKALRDFGLVVFLDHPWSDRLSSSVGYSRVDISNSDGQLANAYKNGQYVIGNLLVTPVKNVMVGGELQWLHRQNYSDGFSSDDFRVQFSFKYSFGYKLGG